jgi:hypothetical protein
MSEQKDDRTDEEKREEVRALLSHPMWQKRSIKWLAEEVRVHWDIVADERRKLGMRMDVKLQGRDGKWRLCGKGRISRDRAPLNGEQTKSLLTLYDAVVRQLQSGSLDPHELKHLAASAKAAAGYHREVLNRSSPKRPKVK